MIYDAVLYAQIATAKSFNYTPYIVAGLLFVLLTIPMTRLTDWVSRRAGLDRRGWSDMTVSDRVGGDGTAAVAAPLLEITGLRKAYGPNVVLRNVSLSVRPHECVVLIGASGSGKSSLLRCVNLLEQVDDGVILLDGRDITDPTVKADEVRARVGIVFQAFNLFPHMNVLDNITLAPRRVHGTPRRRAEADAMAMLDRVGLADKAKAKPDELSGGQQQRVAIARALVNRPVLMLFDEVTSALDPELVGEVLDLLAELKRRRHDDAGGDPRDGVRPAGGRRGGLPGRRRHRRGRAPRAGAGEPCRPANPTVPAPDHRQRTSLTP